MLVKNAVNALVRPEAASRNRTLGRGDGNGNRCVPRQLHARPNGFLNEGDGEISLPRIRQVSDASGGLKRQKFVRHRDFTGVGRGGEGGRRRSEDGQGRIDEPISESVTVIKC